MTQEDSQRPDKTAEILAWWEVLKARRPYLGKVAEFVAKWERKGDLRELNERQGAQMHFIDLCDILDVPSPNDLDDYVFEKRGLMLGGKRGYADVFKRGYFAWEYKAPGGNLDAALRQLLMYALALDNPPLLVVSDRFTIEIHSHFNGTPSIKTVVDVSKLEDPAQLAILRRLFTDPESFRPQQTVQALTEEAANAFATLADDMRQRKADDALHAQQVAHFLTQCVFCLFAEDAKILATDSFSRILGLKAPPVLIQRQFTQLFAAMQGGDLFGADFIPWFNGGLFATVDVPELQAMDIAVLKNARGKDWSQIDVSIFGTLFERGLNPAKRRQLGAHYTDTATIARLIEPVVARPLLLEWERTRLEMVDLLALQGKAKDEDRNRQIAAGRMVQFLEKLKNYRILDPACGSGNFLYLALKTLKDIEHKVNTEAQLLGLHRQVDSYTSPANVLGIELDSYAAELARVSVWIGELQWRSQHGYGFPTDPILQTLDHIECRDAILTPDGKEADWPQASVVIGNPPFLGGKKFVSELGEDYTAKLHAAFKGRVPGLADLVTYWFERARAQMMQGKLSAAGLVSTNSIRNGFSREVLERVAADTPIFAAWSDEPWVNEGAAVRVSLVAFSRFVYDRTLNGAFVEKINADLSVATMENRLDLTTAQPLEANQGVAFQGTTRSGPFDISGELARHFLALPNPHGKPNSDVVRPWSNGLDVTRRATDTWIIDFGIGMTFDEAALYEAPFAHCLQHVKPTRVGNRNPRLVEQWWHYDGVRVKLREATKTLRRYIATTITAKHRLFVWKDVSTLPDATLAAIASDSDAVFGVLHSRFHEIWSLRMGSTLEDRPRYVLEPCFETFPFPFKVKPADVPEATLDKGYKSIAAASQSLCTLRDRWLNPPEYTRRVPEILDGYPERILPRDDLTEAQLTELKKRTLTNLYNLRPSWLASAHLALDAAVAMAYGWTDYTPAMTDEEILGRLLALNLKAVTQPI